jgi:hypothetical protein
VWYFFITFIHCSDGVVFFDYIYALFRRCGIFWLHLCTVPTVWYFLITFIHCSDGVVFFLLHLCTVPTVWYFFYYIYALFRRCDIFLLHLCTVPTVWYFLSFIFLGHSIKRTRTLSGCMLEKSEKFFTISRNQLAQSNIRKFKTQNNKHIACDAKIYWHILDIIRLLLLRFHG